MVLAGGTLTNAGLIGGGVNPGGGIADAVSFNGAATLIIDPGAVFNGLVAANTSFADVLEFGSSATVSSLVGIGRIAELPYPRAKSRRQVPKALRQFLAAQAMPFTAAA